VVDTAYIILYSVGFNRLGSLLVSKKKTVIWNTQPPLGTSLRGQHLGLTTITQG
jgi:hypothetical protein